LARSTRALSAVLGARWPKWRPDDIAVVWQQAINIRKMVDAFSAGSVGRTSHAPEPSAVNGAGLGADRPTAMPSGKFLPPAAAPTLD
jgi:hypothetical protein